MKEADFYERVNGKIKCLLCPRECIIGIGKTGFCRARKNEGGKLLCRIYAECSSICLDPIEKKPLYHFYPGTYILSLGTIGCNFSCKFCQNWQISQREAPTQTLLPEEAVKLAIQKKAIGIAYTYNEPFIWYEYVRDTAEKAKKEGLKNVLVTNGYINKEPLLSLLPFIDALNIDVKSISGIFYQNLCNSTLEPVLRNAELAKKYAHVEITNLIIPTLNDTPSQIRQLVVWLKENLGKDTPLHFSRYFPHYQLEIPPTPISTLKEAYNIAKEEIEHVYIGNIWDEETGSTYCAGCKRMVIGRRGYNIFLYNLVEGRCKNCARPLPGCF